MLENGYVTLPRSIAKKEWFTEGNTLKLYITLLFNAAFKDTETGGVAVKKGQFLTSVRRLALMTNMAKQTVADLLKHLEEAGEITVESTTKYSIITLNDVSDEPSDRTQNRTQNQTQNRTRSSKVIEEKEEKEEKSKEEEAAAPPPADCPCDINISLITREELTAKYGEDTVARYERKFGQWASSKPFVNAALYPTIAKWMAEDIPHAPKAPQPLNSSKKPSAPNAPRSPEKGSPVNTDELRKRIMERYRNNDYVNI